VAGGGGEPVAGGGGEPVAGGSGEGEPCGDLDYFGRCNGSIVEWCNEEGFFESYDCSLVGFPCELIGDEIGYDCNDGGEPIENPNPDPECEGLDFLGRCNGTIAEWCENGTFQSYDCAEEGLPCAYIDEEVGYFCVE
ncbi:hypothetical protein KJ940_05425, partial [Myxococcota bacterium]|nr:hypothetical protein [Myxococcota bacterium]